MRPDGQPSSKAEIIIDAKNDKGKELYLQRFQVLNGIVNFVIPFVPKDSSKLLISVSSVI